MSKNRKTKIGLVSISDRASEGTYRDKGIPALEDWLKQALLSDYETVSALIPDEQPLIEATLKRLCDEDGCDLILTTGGTGPSRRDVTPEATLAVATRVMPGFGEQMRAVSLAFVPTAILSRQVGVLREIKDHAALILNLPGQPKAIAETLQGLPSKGIHGIFAAIPYCIELIGGPSIETRPEIVKVFRPKSAELPEIIEKQVIEPAEGKADSAFIMLHGLGADSSDFAHFREELIACGAPMEQTRFILPSAPVRPISMNNGYPMKGWFDLFSLDNIDKEDEAGLLETWKIIERLIAQEETKGIDRSRIFLGGFSQGGCMALFSALKMTRPIGGIIGISCYLPLMSRYDAEHVGDGILSPIFVGYGKQDNIVPPPFTEISINELRKLGATDLWSKGYPGIEHNMCLEEVQDLSDFLERCLNGNP